MENKNGLEEFKRVCRESFRYLIDEYKFVELPLPSEKFVNEFQVRFGREQVTIVILGEGYGTVADISFHFKEAGRFAYQQFLPGHKPYKKGAQKGKDLTQLEQIRLAAEQIKANCVDVLRGERTELSPWSKK